MDTTYRRSPVHRQLASDGDRLAQFGLHDWSLRTVKLGLKGPGVPTWLADQGVPLPDRIYDTLSADDRVLSVRIATDEIVIEAPAENTSLIDLDSKLGSRPEGVFRVETQSATFLLQGTHAPRLWSQTCGVPIVDEPLDRIIYTRVAGIACAIIPQQRENERVHRIWVDYGFAPALWDAFVEILKEQSG